MSHPPPDVNPCRCPLCGQPNACALVTPKAGASGVEPCWCMLVQFSGDLLKRVPEMARNKACICATCVAASDGANQHPPKGGWA